MVTLKSLVDETTNIKDELVLCHTNLKNNLVNKGIAISPNAKLVSLISEVSEMKCLPSSVTAGDDLRVFYDSTKYSVKSTTNSVLTSTVVQLPGSYRASFELAGSGSKGTVGVIQHLRDSSVLSSKQFTDKNGQYGTTLYVLDITNVQKNDIIKFLAWGPGGTGTYYYAKNCTVSCEFKL